MFTLFIFHIGDHSFGIYVYFRDVNDFDLTSIPRSKVVMYFFELNLHEFSVLGGILHV